MKSLIEETMNIPCQQLSDRDVRVNLLGELKTDLESLNQRYTGRIGTIWNRSKVFFFGYFYPYCPCLL